jgi:threonine/homoserine/homoserine lactone efflux protein
MCGRPAIRGHLLVLLATMCGIVGMGLVFTGATAGNLAALTLGLPLLFLGLWWAGIQLGRSQMENRARRLDRTQARSPDGTS